jgi:hypothetical protein
MENNRLLIRFQEFLVKIKIPYSEVISYILDNNLYAFRLEYGIYMIYDSAGTRILEDKKVCLILIYKDYFEYCENDGLTGWFRCDFNGNKIE